MCSGGRYDSLASDGRTTYPGVGISIGLTRLVHLLVAERGLTASRSTPAAVLVAVVDEETRDRSRAVATALRARGIPCEVAPSDAKFGKQIRYADRRGIPFVWFPGAGDGRRPGQGHPLRRAGGRRRRHVGSAPRPTCRPVWSPRSDRNEVVRPGRAGAGEGRSP